MKRISFNGGELSPGIAARPDLDVYHRGASVLENVDVSQTGGVSRRHGMKRVFAALEGSILLPYVYSTNDRFLVEVAPSLLRVLSVEGDVVASLPSVWTAADVSALRHKQVNSMLFTCLWRRAETSAAVHTEGREATTSPSTDNTRSREGATSTRKRSLVE